jgi:hypothetical protein
MAVAMLIENPNGSQEIYEQLRERIGLDKPAGGMFHVAGPSPNGGWRVIEIWEVGGGREAVPGQAPAAGGRGALRPAATSARALARPQLHDGVGGGRRRTRAGPGRVLDASTATASGVTGFGTEFSANAAAIEPDGGIVAAGFRENGGLPQELW